MRIPIFTDEAEQSGGWHGAQLAQAFKARGVQAVFVNLQDCVIDLSREQPEINIPYFTENPPAAFVRGIAGGTLQQITTRLNMLHMLHLQGVKIYNNAKAIERTVDKAMTSFLLSYAGIATPPTWVCENRNQAHAIIAANIHNTRLLIKPLFGSQGRGIRLLEQSSLLPLPMDTHVDGVFYLQQLIETGGDNYDYRIFVINNQAVAAMRRSGSGWLHNVAQGAVCEAIEDIDVMQLAEQAANVLEIDYCGVDIIRDLNGKLWVLEINSIPAWRGLQSVVKNNINQLLADDLLKKVLSE